MSSQIFYRCKNLNTAILKGSVLVKFGELKLPLCTKNTFKHQW